MKKIFFLITYIFLTFVISAQDYSQVYLIGGATPNGWDNGKAQKMNLVESSDQSAIFSWTGVLTQNDFKFINALNSWMPCFNAPSANQAIVLGQTYNLVYNPNNNDIDYKFIITQAGVYTVTVDLKKLTIIVKKEAASDFDDVWVTGSAIPNTSVKLSKGIDGTFIYGGPLLQGDLKFMSTATAGENTQYFVPVLEDDEISGTTSFQITDDANAAGWYVMVDDPLYKIKINTLRKESTAQIFNPNKRLYIVGGATEAGWDATNAIELQQDAQNKSIYVFDGNLELRPENVESNAFKILGQQGWDPYSLHSINANEPILGATHYAESINGSYADNKWTIDADHQGHYIIKFNTIYETVESQYINNTSGIVETKENDLFHWTAQRGGVLVQLLNGNSAQNAQLISLAGRCICSANNVGKEFFLSAKNGKGVYILQITSDKKKVSEQVLIK